MPKKDAKVDALDSTSIFDSVYLPSIQMPDEEILKTIQTKAVQTIEEAVGDLEKVFKSFDVTAKEHASGPKPITNEEMVDVNATMSRMKKDIERIQGKIASVETAVDNKMSSESDSTFVFKFKKKPRLKRAVKVITGLKKNNITYEDYKLALKIKTDMETEDAQSFFEED